MSRAGRDEKPCVGGEWSEQGVAQAEGSRQSICTQACKKAPRELDGKPGIRVMSWAQRRKSGSRQTEERKVTSFENSEVTSDLD